MCVTVPWLGSNFAGLASLPFMIISVSITRWLVIGEGIAIGNIFLMIDTNLLVLLPRDVLKFRARETMSPILKDL